MQDITYPLYGANLDIFPLPRRYGLSNNTKKPVINKMACRHILHSVGDVFCFRIGLPFGRPVANTLTPSFVSEKIQENTV